LTVERDKAARMLRTARGQIDGVLKMIEDDRYCVDISAQILAARAVLGTANREVLRGHMAGCMTAAMKAQEPEVQEKMLAEFMSLLEKM